MLKATQKIVLQINVLQIYGKLDQNVQRKNAAKSLFKLIWGTNEKTFK